MTPSQVAKLVGCHPGTIRGRIRDGTLKAHRSPVRANRYRIHRESLVRWLVGAGWEAHRIREVMPQPGPLFVVSSRPRVLMAVHSEPRRVFHSMFEAALAMRGDRPWGLLVDVVEVGMGDTCSSVSRYYREIDRPLLIAIHSDDGVREGCFDFGIPDDLPPGKIAQRIRSLRPWSGR